MACTTRHYPLVFAQHLHWFEPGRPNRTKAHVGLGVEFEEEDYIGKVGAAYSLDLLFVWHCRFLW